MVSLFLETFVTWVVLVGMCQAGTLERSNLAPLSIVYTVYPYYNSDTLLGIIKPDEPFQVIDNVFERQSSAPEPRNPVDNEASDGTSGTDNRESLRNDSDESAPARHDEASEITYWPPIQRGAVPKSRLSRTAGPRPSNPTSDV